MARKATSPTNARETTRHNVPPSVTLRDGSRTMARPLVEIPLSIEPPSSMAANVHLVSGYLLRIESIAGDSKLSTDEQQIAAPYPTTPPRVIAHIHPDADRVSIRLSAYGPSDTPTASAILFASMPFPLHKSGVTVSYSPPAEVIPGAGALRLVNAEPKPEPKPDPKPNREAVTIGTTVDTEHGRGEVVDIRLDSGSPEFEVLLSDSTDTVILTLADLSVVS